jgi:hypothetical protein
VGNNQCETDSSSKHKRWGGLLVAGRHWNIGKVYILEMVYVTDDTYLNNLYFYI